MATFWQIVNDVIKKADILLILLDARCVDKTRNSEVESKVNHSGKPLIYVITKCDLVEKDTLEHYKQELHPCVFISSTTYAGLSLLKERIFIESKKIKSLGHEIYVGVIGYPNTGKSSLINAMTGRGVASKSPISGWTRSVKKICGTSGLIFLDTPGVIPVKETDTILHGVIGAIDSSKIKDIDLVVIRIIQERPGVIEEFYGVKPHNDQEDTVAEIALKKNLILKGGEPDISRAYTLILRDWQTGKISAKGLSKK